MGTFFYTPVFAMFGACILLAFHRAKIVSGKPTFKVQLPAYLLLLGITFACLYGAKVLVTRRLKEAHISIPDLAAKIASDVVSSLANTMKPTPNAQVMEKNSPAQKPPTPSLSIKPKEEPKLIFKASSLFTVERKRRITDEVGALYRYLVHIGFDCPKEIPPLETVRGSALGTIQTGPGTIFNGKLVIGEKNLDNPESIRKVFAYYVFDTLFNVGDPSRGDRERLFYGNASLIFSEYYLSSFGEKNIRASLKPDSYTWQNTLWEIRKKHGKDFVDRALFYSYKTWRPKDSKEENFDTFFLDRFLYGVGIVDNNFQNHASVVAILKARGLSPQ